MSNHLNSDKISKHLLMTMLVIIISVILISSSLVSVNYSRYQLSQVTLKEIQTLKMTAELAHLISRERAPSNKVLASPPQLLAEHQQKLAEYRKKVDQSIMLTQQQMINADFDEVAKCIDQHIKPALKKGRQQVDAYAALPHSQQTSAQMDSAIQAMYHAWDATYLTLKHLIKDSQGRSSSSSDYYTLILILADLRDQAGRVASNIMPAVSFKEPIPKENLGRTLQTQRQTQHLWELIDAIQPEQRQTKEFVFLYQQVNSQFLQQGIPLIQQLTEQSLNHQPYSVSGIELTDIVSPYFVTVIDLQDYLLEQSLIVVQQDQNKARQQLVFAFTFSIIAIMAVLVAIAYIRYSIFNPLFRAQRLLLELISGSRKSTTLDHPTVDDKLSFFGAIEHLKLILKQRDDFEFKLKNIASTDALSGVNNRMALEEYIKYKHQTLPQFIQTCLFVIDIDYFKQVNDQFGHQLGDEVIRQVANTLKTHIRTSDMVVRYGGDEFLLLLENITAQRATEIAEKIRLDVINHPLQTKTDSSPLYISLSIGIACQFPQWDELMKAADDALLQAKANGRNCVVCHPLR